MPSSGAATKLVTSWGETLLTCLVVDQAALYGLLRRVRDLGVPLISVTPVNPARQAAQMSNRKVRQV